MARQAAPASTALGRRWRDLSSSDSLAVARDLAGAVRRNRLTAHATSLAFRVLISLVPLALLGIGLLGTFGIESVWRDSISPAVHHHLTASVARAADDTARRIFESNGAWLLLFACVLLLWNTLRAIREVEHTLDEIHEQDGRRRSFLQGLAVGIALAVAVDLCVFGALLVVIAAPRLVDHGVVHGALEASRWVGAVLLLWLAVTLLLRYAPAERPEARWASGGSALVVGGWLAASAAFGFWSASVANYKTPIGTLAAFLVLTAYTLVVSYVFVLGAQLDESLRRRKRSG